MKDPAIRSNRIQCFFALISASIVAVCVCVGVVMNLVTLYDENFDHMGIRTFCSGGREAVSDMTESRKGKPY